MIKQLLLQILSNEFKIMPLLCKVESVSGMTCNVLPVNGDAAIHNVRLIADANAEKYFAVVPKVGSHVLVIFLTNASAFVSLIDEADKVIYKVDNVILDIDANGFLLKRETENLLQLVIDLINAIETAVYNTPSGPTTGMVSTAIFEAIKTRFTTLLKSS